jgi:hypothetical protein
MIRYVIVSVASGLLFGILDGVLNANPLAQKLFAAYKPIARPSVNAVAGIVIDLVYGFVMAGLFLLLYAGIPGDGWVKGMSFALIAWFFRVAMSAASQWVMFTLPLGAIVYTLFAGLLEMVVIGLVYGFCLKPPAF